MLLFFLRWAVSAAALLGVATLVPGLTVASFGAAMIGAGALAVVNSVIGPVVRLLSLPIRMLTLGLFSLVINAALFALAVWLVDGFEADGPTAVFVGSLAYGVASWIIQAVFRQKK